MTARPNSADVQIRQATTIAVVLLAAIAAVGSYRHMRELALQHGETWWTAALIPLSVDGMVIASSMSILLASRSGQRAEWLSWALLIVGSLASLTANIAVAEPTPIGRVIAAWPSFAFVGAYELLMRQVRYAAARKAPIVSDVGTAPAVDGDASPDTQTAFAEDLASNTEAADEGPGEQGNRACGRRALRLQLQAWQWAVANRTSTGDLPSGKVIGDRFGRSERWGRLVNQAGRTGRLESTSMPVDVPLS